MKISRQALGAWGEEQAANYLIEAGYEILDRNVRTSYGEIDLVAWHEYTTERHTGEDSKHGMIVFVEVKTRRSTSFGYPEQAVNARKMEHMIASAQAYLQKNLDYESAYRIDVIAILHTNPGKEPEIIHFENAA